MSQSRFLLIPFILLPFAVQALAQEPIVVPEGFVLVDDMILPIDDGTDSVFSPPAWPGGIVPYSFNANVSAGEQALMRDAMAEWEAVANVRFVERTTEPNFVLISSNGAGCAGSNVGMVGGQQGITIGSCWSVHYTLVHELGHTLGLQHEHTRPDRDSFMTINTANIVPTALGNFDISPTAVNATTYDPFSIMHYGQTAFSVNGQPTITLTGPWTAFQSDIGNRVYMTTLDATGMQSKYGAPPRPVITSIPTVLPAGTGTHLVTILGKNFFRGSPNSSGVIGTRAKVDGVQVTTTYVSPTEIQALIDLSLFPGRKLIAITADNAAPGGGASAPALILVGTQTATASRREVHFESQWPRSNYVFPPFNQAAQDPEYVTVNGAGAGEHRVSIDTENGRGMPFAGSQYLRVPGHGGAINVPLGDLIPMPLTGPDLNANQVYIPVPSASRVSFVWDWFCDEVTSNSSYNDGFSVDLVDPVGNRVLNFLRGDTSSPVPPGLQYETQNYTGHTGHDTFDAGPQVFSARIPAGSQYAYLVVTSWNGGDNNFTSDFLIDQIAFGNGDDGFESGTPESFLLPAPLASGFTGTGPNNSSWNGAGLASANFATVDRSNGRGMPTNGERHLVVDANGPIGHPASGLIARPLAAAAINVVNEVRIPIPAGTRVIEFDWDFYAAEPVGNAPYVDGLNIDVLRPNLSRLLNLVAASTEDARAPVQTGNGGMTADPNEGTEDLLSNGPQHCIRSFSQPLPAGAILSIVVWNGSDNGYSSQAVLDNLVFHGNGGEFNLNIGTHGPSGSLQIEVSDGQGAGNLYFTALTLTAGNFPHGWFPNQPFGIDLAIGDLYGQLAFQAPPFFGALDLNRQAIFELPGGLPPGINLFATTLQFAPNGFFLGATLPVVYTTR